MPIKPLTAIAAISCVTACIAGLAAATNAVVQDLEVRSIVQCHNHDWPAHQHQAHMDWCESNGYFDRKVVAIGR